METNELVRSMIDDVLQGNAAAAQEKFGDIISVKSMQALDARKVELAQSVFQGKSDE